MSRVLMHRPFPHFRSVRFFVSLLTFLSVLASGVGAAEPVVVKFIEAGEALKLNAHERLGDEQKGVDGSFTVRSAKPGTADEFGSHYISVGLMGDAILAPGDFEMTLKMGLLKLSEGPEPVMLNIKIGSHWYEFAFDEERVTMTGVLYDTVRREPFEIDHKLGASLDGEPFTLKFARVDGMLRIDLDGKLMQTFPTEPVGGDVALCIERKSLLRVETSVDDTEAEIRIYDWNIAGEFEAMTEARREWEALSDRHWRLMKRVGEAYAFVKDDPDLPNVLLIGDSISIYYTDTVRRLLAGHADVYRTPMGPGKAETLFESLDDFLAGGSWDVIHFNSGLHDFARTGGTPEDLALYRKNLETIIAKLRNTGAKLVWGNTTPVPEKAIASSDLRCQAYNAEAATLMAEENIPVNDLYNAILPNHSLYWTAPNNIHFNSSGSALLGRRVANAVLEVLQEETVDQRQ